MAASPLLLAIDQGTTGTTALLVGLDGAVHRRAYREVPVSYPHPGWVEQDAERLWASVLGACGELLEDGVEPATLGITNQRETVVVFEREGLRPVAPAIVWQCRRSAQICEAHRRAGDEPELRARTGLLLDPYFTATKLEWLLRERPELRVRAQAGEATRHDMHDVGSKGGDLIGERWADRRSKVIVRRAASGGPRQGAHALHIGQQRVVLLLDQHLPKEVAEHANVPPERCIGRDILDGHSASVGRNGRKTAQSFAQIGNPR